MSVYYHGSDGHIHQLGDRKLQHWKYIKKIGNRYFYSLDELQAYYQDEKSKANREASYNKRQAKSDRDYMVDLHKTSHKNARKRYAENGGFYVSDGKGGAKAASKKDRAKAIARDKKQEKRQIKSYDRTYKLQKTKISAVQKAKPIINTGKAALAGSTKAPKTTKSKYTPEQTVQIRKKSSQAQKQRLVNRRKKAQARYTPKASNRW